MIHMPLYLANFLPDLKWQPDLLKIDVLQRPRAEIVAKEEKKEGSTHSVIFSFNAALLFSQ